MDAKIKEYYENYLYPNLDTLYKYMHADKITISKKQIKEWLDKQEEVQITKETKNIKKESGHITAFVKNQYWQLDIFILQKYVKFNHGYKDILAVVDVFTRQAYCVAIKNKGIDDVVEALKKIIKLNGSPQTITSDSDSSFLGGSFQALMKEKNIIHDTVPIGDHHSLGCIDRFARTIKTKFTRIIERNKNANWIDYMDKVVSLYNNTGHSGIADIKPSEAEEGDNVAIILHINKLKNLKNSNIIDLSIGDKVRILETTIFKKGTEPRYSKKIYKVKSVSGKRITLDSGDIKKRNTLLLISADTVESNNNKHLTEEINQNNANERLYIREEVKQDNIVKEKRVRKANPKYA